MGIPNPAHLVRLAAELKKSLHMWNDWHLGMKILITADAPTG